MVYMDLVTQMRRELRMDPGVLEGPATPEIALAAATRHFLDGRRVDMQIIALEVGVGRATLYRWFGDRERLMGQVLWNLSQQALRYLGAQSQPGETEQALATIEAFLQVTSAFAPLQRFLAAEPTLALRALLEPDAPLVVALGDWVTDRLTAAGYGRAPGGPSARELAEVMVSVTSTYCWARIIAGGEADVAAAMRAVRVLLRT
jgi:AcrR family transcriptional regulator